MTRAYARTAPAGRARNRRTVLGEAGFALAASVIAAAVLSALRLLLPGDVALGLVVTALGLAFVLRTLGQAEATTGLITTLGLWAAISVAAWLLAPSPLALVGIHALLVWIVRALYLHSDLLDAGLELALGMLAACFGAWAAIRTGSAVLAFWSWGLVLAFSAAIPQLARGRAHAGAATERDGLRDFAESLAAADAAVQRLAHQPYRGSYR